MSTLVNRTMQSGYSEYLGMFQPSKENGPKLNKRQIQAMQPMQPASPPFKVRNQKKLEEQLGAFALPEGFI